MRSSASESSTGLSSNRKTSRQGQYSSEEDKIVHIERSAAIRRLKLGSETPNSLEQDSDEMSTDEEVRDLQTTGAPTFIFITPNLP